MNRPTVWVSGLTLLALMLPLACSGSGKSTSSGGGAVSSGEGQEDVLHLTNKETVRGRFLGQDGANYYVEQDGKIRQVAAGTVYSVEYSPKTFREMTAPPPQPAAPPAPSAAGPSSWCPRTDSQERIDVFEIDWEKAHVATDCQGKEVAEASTKNPAAILFVPTGGKVVFHDPKRWGWHAHAFPGEPDRFLPPTANTPLALPVPEKESDLPEAVTFVSASREAKTVDGPDRSSYLVADSIHLKLAPLGQAAPMLAVQPFAGGKPPKTPSGSLWAFSMPRNENQFWVYLADPEGNHASHLKSAFVGYGKTRLAEDFVVDVESKTGEVLGRLLCVPFPDTANAEGAAPEPVTVYAGSEKDPTRLATMSLPARPILQPPPRRPGTKADILVSNYDVSRGIPEQLFVAFGRGRPTSGVTVVNRPLSAEKSDEVLKVDLSRLPEDQFPAVVWVLPRRSYVWRTTGGRLPQVEPLLPPSGSSFPPLTLVKVNQGIPHATPILFGGPAARVSGAAGAPVLSLSSGLSDAFMRDNTARESTGLPPLPGGSGTGTAPTGEGLTNTTYVNVVVPPHTAGGPGGIDTSTSSGVARVGGLYLMSDPSQSWRGSGPLGSYGTINTVTGKITNATGQIVQPNPWTGSTTTGAGISGVTPRGEPVISIRRSK